MDYRTSAAVSGSAFFPAPEAIHPQTWAFFGGTPTVSSPLLYEVAIIEVEKTNVSKPTGRFEILRISATSVEEAKIKAIRDCGLEAIDNGTVEIRVRAF